MAAVLNFLRENWKVIVEFSCLLVSLIIFCLKKKTKVTISSSVISDVLAQLPSWINEAESRFGPGEGKRKFVYVLKMALCYVSEETGLDTKQIDDSYGLVIRREIEAILSTPQKKEK